MSLTEDQITGGRTYAVTIDRTLSPKRFRDAVALVKQIGVRPEHTAKYDSATRTWAVTLPSDSVNGLHELRTLVHAYDTGVEPAAQPAAAPAPAAVPPARQTATRSAFRNGIDWAEYSDGFSPIDERPYMGS
jgi:hypothetical protein